jgi:pseudouridine-5'-phosphate glycosidase
VAPGAAGGAGLTDRVVVAGEVRSALADGRPVVALETSVLAQGLPVPRNLEALEQMDAAVRRAGAVPAWTAVLEGAVRVGLPREALEALSNADRAGVMKVARRDIPVAVARGGPGATTVSATLWAGSRVGITVAATGGIGGIHRRSGDVSADLLELARTPGLLVCSGPKSIVDPRATLERLEEIGVTVVGYCTERLPFFLSLDAGIELEHVVPGPAEAASLLRVASELGTPSALLLCNPVPEDHALDPGEVAAAAAACEEEAQRRMVRGKDLTPFVLACMAERTGGATLEANLALLEANARLAGEVAAAAAASGET